MIRNVVLGRLRDADGPAQQAADAELLRTGLAGIAALDLPGCLDMRTGADLGIRAGGWDYAITNDWADTDGAKVENLLAPSRGLHIGYLATPAISDAGFREPVVMHGIVARDILRAYHPTYL